MTRTRIAALLISPFALLLYGCQPDAPAQHAESAPPNSVPLAASQVPAIPQSATQAVSAAKSVTAKQDAPSALDGRALAQKSGCFACHMIEKKLVGPAWNDVASKYHGQKDAEARLVAKVAKGGGGVWGATPMPPNAPRVNENDIKTLVHFILSLK
jgi:cytochrome c